MSQEGKMELARTMTEFSFRFRAMTGDFKRSLQWCDTGCCDSGVRQDVVKGGG